MQSASALSPRVVLPSIGNLRASIAQDEYLRDPAKWVGDKLGEFIWSKQREILESVRDNRRTVVYSCHRIGKSWLGGRIAFYWLDTHKPGEAMVVTSAHSGMQIKMALWREMGRVFSKGKFPGRMNQVEYWMPIPDDDGTYRSGREEMVAFGRKPSDEDPSAFQGTYAKYVLFILDEGCYVPSALWDAADTLIGNEFSRIVAFGNPDDPNTEFGEVCKPGSGWNAIGIGYQDTPNFSGENVPEHVKHMLIGPTWVEEKRKKWGETNPLFISKVLGRFPEITTDGLIPMAWVRAAQERTLEPALPSELGVDVGGGGDENTIAHRQGPVVRIVLSDRNPDTMQTLSNVIRTLKETGASAAKVDNIGIGHGAVDRAKEMAKEQSQPPGIRALAGKIEGVNVSDAAQDNEAYVNLRAEGLWLLRERFREGNIDLDPEDEDTAAELVDLKYKAVGGRIQIESKIEMKRRGKPSPNRADAIMLAFLPSRKRKRRLTWGR